MTAPATATLAIDLARSSAAPTRAIPSRFGRVLGWSASAVLLSPLLIPLGALHALSHVLEVRREGGRWGTSLAALVLGLALLASGSGPRVLFESTYDRTTAALTLQVADRELVRGALELKLTDGWAVTPGGHARLGRD